MSSGNSLIQDPGPHACWTTSMDVNEPKRDRGTPEPPSPYPPSFEPLTPDPSPHPPFFEPLTPERPDEDYAPHNKGSLHLDESTAQSLLHRLRLPLNLDSFLKAIFQVIDEAGQLDEYLVLILSQLPVPEHDRVRDFAYKFCRVCDKVCEMAASSADSARVEDNQQHPKTNPEPREITETEHLKVVSEPQISVKSEKPTTPERDVGIPGKGFQACKDEPKQASIQPTRGPHYHSLPIEVIDENGALEPGSRSKMCKGESVPNDPEVVSEPLIIVKNERRAAPEGPIEDVSKDSGSAPDIFSAAVFRPKAGNDEDSGKDTVASGVLNDTGGTNVLAGSSNVDTSIKPMTPERTPPPTRSADNSITETGKYVCSQILVQPVDDFVAHTYEQIRRFGARGNSSETYKALQDSLQHSAAEESGNWSDGSQWLALMETADSERHKGSVRYALTAISFARWHVFQLRLLEHREDMTTRKARKAVMERIIDPKPTDDATQEKRWELRRQKLATHLTRGQKWSRLVKAFGYGILFICPWGLAKSKDSELSVLIDDLPSHSKKMTILKILASQMKVLLKTGKTNPDEFRNQLLNEGFSITGETISTGYDELDALIRQVRNSALDGRLCIRGTNFRFDMESLQRLGPTRWLNDEIILACLHLSDKLAFTRVGFSVPIHRQTRAQVAISRPFEMAAKQIAEWHRRAGARGPLVSFFPLFQRENHFSLLEVNEREMCIYHYDPMGYGDNTDVKAGCQREFPEYRYIEKETLRQNDSHSCGLLVIRHARYRMLGRLVVSGAGVEYDPDELRAEAITILKSAWANDALIVAPPRKRKVKAGKRDILEETSKRRKAIDK